MTSAVVVVVMVAVVWFGTVGARKCIKARNSVELYGTQEMLHGVEVVWQIPPNTTGILFIAHSASDAPGSYWPFRPDSPSCYGVPEHKALAAAALIHGFALIAIKSVDTSWDIQETSQDLNNVHNILLSWKAAHGLDYLPVSALGSSAGGNFVAVLALKVKLRAIVVMIATGVAEAFEAAVRGVYPPTLFVTMTLDTQTVMGVKRSMATLRAKCIPTAMVPRTPLAVHPLFFEQYIDEIDAKTSEKLHHLLFLNGYIDTKNDLLAKPSPESIDLLIHQMGIQFDRLPDDEVKLRHGSEVENINLQGPEGFRGTRLAQAIDNQIRVAEGWHTLTSRKHDEIFDWINGVSWSDGELQCTLE